MTLPVLDLFSGIGAYSLGLERTGGFRTVAFCEIEEYPRRILRKHWPHVPIFTDVRELAGDRLRAAGIIPDWFVAGWPCQGNSPAGTGLGMDDPRSGLWSEITRLAGEIGPRGLLLENSSNLLNINGGADFGRVLGDLAALGYDAEWHCLPAAAFDAPHIRDRVWIVATLADTDGERSQVSAAGRQPAVAVSDQLGHPGLAPHPDCARVEGLRTPFRISAESALPQLAGVGGLSAHTHRFAPIGTAIARQKRVSWEPEPDVGRVVHGASNRVERIHALGNLNPPIIPELIGRAILEAEARA